MGKLRADEQEPHRRPTRSDELAQHSEIEWFARGGKCGGCAAEQRVLTWGDPTEEMPWEVSRGHSSVQQAGSLERLVKTKRPEVLMNMKG